MARFLWTQREDIGPTPRLGHAMAYSASRGRTLLFGGDDLAGNLLRDTWEWDGEFWTQVADTGPSGRRDHSIAFDVAQAVVLLFGGKGGGGALGDTWTWDGQDWTQVEDSGPSARSGHALAFDRSRNRAVLFGGENAAGNALGDTWEWDGQAWTQVEDAGPPPRRNHMLAYDLTRQRTLLFGGDPGDQSALGDTWEWDGANWTQVEDIGPLARLRAAMASTDAQVTLYGGLDSAATAPPPKLFEDSWVRRNELWTQKQDIGPGPRWGHAMAFDEQRRRLVLFGGHSAAALANAGDLHGDTWEHEETEAPAIQPTPAPGGGGDVAQLILTPDSAQSGEMVTADVILNGPSQAPTEVTLLWVLESVIVDANNNGQPVDPGDIHNLGQLTIPAGDTTGNFAFAAPPNPGELIVVAAITPSGSQALAQLQITS